MLDDLGVGFASIWLLFGTILLFVAISDPHRDQTLTVIGGTLLLSLGMVAAWRPGRCLVETRLHFGESQIRGKCRINPLRPRL